MTAPTDDGTCPHVSEGDGRPCLRPRDHKQNHQFAALEGQNCTCMLRWYPNRCAAHPENNG